MEKLKVIALSSFITLLLVSVIFAYFYYQDREESPLAVSNSEAIVDSQSTSESNIIPVNIRTQQNNSINLSRNNIITNTVKNISSAVVGINVTETRYYRDPISRDPFFRQFFGDRIFKKDFPGLGSGAIISPDGYIVTNDHVAGNASEIVITMTDGTRYNADLVGTDMETDVSLLKIEADDLPYIKFGTSDDLLIGEWVIALGNPFGLFSINNRPTVTVGVISSLEMNLGVIQERYYMNMIQTDASINGGNSGGPLVNSLGEMIGMNTIILQENRGGSIGLGFAIPVNTVKNIVEELKNKGEVKRDFWTGISIHSIDEGIANYYNLNSTNGVIITRVDRNSPASKAGLEVGDVILQVNNTKIMDENTLLFILHQARTNDVLRIQVLRDNERKSLNMKLESKT
jgi:serine protease Do